MPLVSAVALELAILHTIAQLWYATTDQLHTMCFPAEASSRTRLCLAALRAAGCLDLTPWRLPRVCLERGGIWTLTQAGGAMLAAYGGTAVASQMNVLDVPSTALERDEWRVRMAVRSLIVRLIVQARRIPILADLQVQVRSTWPTPYAPAQLNGDAQLDLVWTPAMVQEGDWLPWTAAAPRQGTFTRYLVYIDRPLAVDAVLRHALVRAQDADATAVIVWQTTERLDQALRVLPMVETLACPIRMTTPALVEHDLVDADWRDAQGQPCSFRPRIEELRCYHAPITA